jgi:hypothetical protein
VIEGQRKNSAAVIYAHNYVKDLNRPLTEDDINIAYRQGMVYGSSSAWQKVQSRGLVFD